MNMHGFSAPADEENSYRANTVQYHIAKWTRSHRYWLLFVALPSLVVAVYYWVIASNQYESEAHIAVRAVSPGASSPTLGQLFTFGTSNSESSQALSVSDYLTSHDAVSALRPRGLVEKFERPEADFFSRLRNPDPSPERLLDYYRSHVEATLNSDTNIVTIKARTFRPEDSYRIVQDMLLLGEKRVNALNSRAYNDTLKVARQQLAESETGMATIQAQLARFRQTKRDIDPKGSGEAQMNLAYQLKQQLALAQSQLAGITGTIGTRSPQYAAVAARVAGLQRQVNVSEAHLTDGVQSISAGLGPYEDLQMRQQFLAKRYDAAASALEKARDQALRQQSFLVRVVEPNLPVKSTYPHRWNILITVFLGLQIAYAIGWLIAAGMREHAA